jgi:hypothetical protein
MGLNILVIKIGPLHRRPETEICDFLEKCFDDFDSISAVY